MTPWDSRRNNFDCLRLAFALLVIYSHAYPLGTGSEVQEPFRVATHGQVTGGAIAVDAFFIMSGFLIAASAERSRSAWAFLGKRVRRIYPGFLVCALLSALLVVPVAGGRLAAVSTAARAGDFLWHSLRLTEFGYVDVFRANPYPGVVNGSVWSIPFEFFCYVGVALLLLSGLLQRRVILLGLFLAAVAVGVAFQVQGWVLGGGWLGRVVGIPQFWARLLPLYLAGVVFYHFRERIALRSWMAAVAAGLLIAGSWISFGWALLFPLAGAYLLLWLAFTPRLRLHGFGRFGDFSYGTYLYAFPIEQLLMQWFGHAVAPWVLFCWATPLTLLAAAGSWYGVERHFLAPARRKETLVHAVLEEVG